MATERIQSRIDRLLDQIEEAGRPRGLGGRSKGCRGSAVTVMFTDIENFTTTYERLGDTRAQEVLHTHNAIIRQQVGAHQGFEVKSQGDGFMMAFSSARRALECAIAIQQAFAVHKEAHPDEPIRVRIGLHTGEAIKEGGDFFGKTVILAARIACEA